MVGRRVHKTCPTKTLNMNSRDLCSNYKKQLVFVLDKLLKCEIIESALQHIWLELGEPETNSLVIGFITH